MRPDPVPPPPKEVLFAKASLQSVPVGQVLVWVDHLTTPGLGQVIGPIGFGSIDCMDFDPEGHFFAVGAKSGLPGVYLIEIDPATGAGTRIGGPLVGVSASFASDSHGNLYGASPNYDALYRIDRVTGLSQRVGPFGYDATHQGMDFSPDDVLYLLTREIGSGTAPTLLTVDVNTGRATPVATVTVDFGHGSESLVGRTSSYDVSFSLDGTLYASMVIDGQSWLLKVNTTTGAAKPVGIMRIPDGQGGFIRVDTSSLAFGPVAWANIPPVARIAAPDQVEATSPTGANVTLDGSGSYDPDSSEPLVYQWMNASMTVLGTSPILTLTLPIASNLISLSVTDSSGKIGTTATIVRVVDTTPPRLVCPADLTLEGQSPQGVPVTEAAIAGFLAGATATDACDPWPFVVNNAPPEYFPLGATVVTFTARDRSGNISVGHATVRVVDTTPPTLVVPDDMGLQGLTPQGVPATDSAIGWFLAEAMATDICDISPVITHDAPADYFPFGSTVVTFTARDASGNVSQRQATVDVVDSLPPILTCPNDIRLEGQSSRGVPVTDAAVQAFLAGATATDICDTSPVITRNAPTDNFPLGNTVVTFTARDAFGNVANGRATVAVVDTTPPNILCPANLTLEGQSPQGVPVTAPAILAFLAAATATDVCDPAPIITNNAPADSFPLGNTVVTFTARDASGNVSFGQAAVRVVDTTPPAIVGPGPIWLRAEGPNGVPVANPAIQAFLAGASASDICDPSPVITNNAPADYFPLGITVVTFTARDASGNSAACQSTVEVVVFPPTVGPIHAPVDPVRVNTEINAWADFTDPCARLTHTATWDWGDGSVSEGRIEETSGSGTAYGSHAYSASGVYVIRLTVTSSCGLSGESEYRYVVVYNPDGGFVTGGGWIDSPAGASADYPSVTGKANLGFVAHYNKDATVPSGQVEFNFGEAGLNFHSSSLKWLVVAGARAKLEGAGTINRQGKYKFILTAIDADINPDDAFSVDRFRIRIWSDVDGAERVVYDNGLSLDDEIDPVNATTQLDGGSIVIHKAE